jgi:hypothetical protein
VSESVPLLVASFRTAFHTMVETLLEDEINDGAVKLEWTDMSTGYANDIVFIGEATVQLVDVTSNRGREVTMALLVETQSFRSGGADADPLAFNAALDLMHRISEQVRKVAPAGDTTLGGVVRSCQLVDVTTEFGAKTAAEGKGRLWSAIGVFEAKARLRG